MHRPAQHLSQTSALPPTKLSRKDYISAQLVEIGIVIQALQGTEHAAQYLRSKKVDIDVVLRVLSQPSERRTWNSLESPVT
jgi:hypothetical protein